MPTYATYLSQIDGKNLPWFVWVDNVTSLDHSEGTFARMCEAGWQRGGDPLMNTETLPPGAVRMHPEVEIFYNTALGRMPVAQDQRGPYSPPKDWLDSIEEWDNRCLTLFGVTGSLNFNLQRASLTQVLHLWQQQAMVAAMCDVVTR